MSTKDELARRRSVLSPEKRALLEKRMHAKATAQPTIPPRPAEGPIPASCTQQRFWFLQELDPESTAYNEVTAWRANGYLHPAILMRVIREIVRRHEVLRTTYRFEQGEVQQVIDADAHLQWELPLHDLRDYEPAQRAAEQARLIMAEAQRPFRLHEELPWRIQLLQLDETQHILVINMHHIVIDEWSMQVFLQELTTLYAAFSGGQPAHLPDLPIQYADYAYWQQQQLAGEAFKQQLVYWQQQLGGALPFLDIPTDRARPHVQSDNGRRCYFKLPHSLHQGLQLSSLQAGTTLFMTLLAAFNVLLFRYSGQEDILVGSPIAGRTYTELEHLVGCFFNTVVFRTNLSGAPTFQELLQRVRTLTLAAYEHQDIPFDKLVEELHPVRDASRPLLFQAMFVLQNMPQATQELSALSAFTLNPVEAESHTSIVDLLLSVQETAQELAGYLEYNSDLFDADSIDRFLAHFQRLLEGIVADPTQPIERIPLLAPAEQIQLLYTWNATTAPYPDAACLHHLFEEQVARTPQALALICGGVALTYHELNQRANQLAHHLQTIGVAADVYVALCLERSIEQMIGLLGILKAGGAYLPIDPAHPQERIAFVLDDAEVVVLLTQELLLGHLPVQPTRQVICLDRDWQRWDNLSRENPVSETNAANSAYVIYTSGSTGRPKGVLVPHRAVVNHNTSFARHYQLTQSDRVLQFASLSFDVAVAEIFPTWCSGATLVMRPRELAATFAAFVDFVAAHDITLLSLPTAYWHHWMAAWDESEKELSLPETLRMLIVAGEEARPAALASWLRHAGSTVSWSNGYGPTETTILTTIYDYDETAPHDEAPAHLPIGRPIANVCVYVLDSWLQPVPIGVVGELYVGGSGVASGYLNRAELTNERFSSDPFREGGRLYRTGDMVRYRADGNLEFLGRSDQQVKIRGFRIELGEIESVLNTHLHVRESVVLARKDAMQESHLVAYVILQAGQSVSNHELWQYLQERLPDYMLPGAFIELQSFPITASGKIDRQRLPEAGPTATVMQNRYVAPRTAIEEVLAGIWVNILGVEQVGIHDNFFMRGGHSLLATRLIARLQSTFEIVLPLRLVFEAPTPALFAEAMLRAEGERENIEEIAELLLSVMHMSDEEVEAMLE